MFTSAEGGETMKMNEGPSSLKLLMSLVILSWIFYPVLGKSSPRTDDRKHRVRRLSSSWPVCGRVGRRQMADRLTADPPCSESSLR